MKRFLIEHNDIEDSVTIYLDGEEIECANHDSHGWDGMKSLEDLVKRIAVMSGMGYDETDVTGPHR